MLLLEDTNRVVVEELARLGAEETLPEVDVAFADFGGTTMRLVTLPKKGAVRIEMALPGHASLLAMGLEAHLRSAYGSAANVHVTESAVAVELPAKAACEAQTAQRLSELRRIAQALPLERAMANTREGRATPLASVTVHGSAGDTLYVQGGEDRVTAVLATRFEDASDAVLARVFMQELFDVRRQSAALQNAPAVLVDREPPRELRGSIPAHQSGATFVTLVLLEPHIAPERSARTCSLVLMLRDYMHYHVKCVKAYMHRRMRAKVAHFVRVLNRSRALPEDACLPESS